MINNIILHKIYLKNSAIQSTCTMTSLHSTCTLTSLPYDRTDVHTKAGSMQSLQQRHRLDKTDQITRKDITRIGNTLI